VDQKPTKVVLLPNTVRGRAPGQRQWPGFAQHGAAYHHLEYEPRSSFPQPWPQASAPPAALPVPAVPVAAPATAASLPKQPASKLASPPTILLSDWLSHCDRHPDRRGDNLGDLSPKFQTLGFRRLQQLTGNDRVTVEKLAQWIAIPMGMADLIIGYAEEDWELAKHGKFEIVPADT
jgi:hypothetical protein